ncbi:MAG: hypothetical protein AB7I19_17870 [Planctomycetota bacterium]
MFRTLALLTSLLLLAGCNKDANAGDVAGSITKVLTGITDGKTAEAAKSELETLTNNFGSVLEKLKGDGKAATDGIAGKVGELAKGALASLAPQFKGITEQISRLMNIKDVVAQIGPVLEKLKGLIPAGN